MLAEVLVKPVSGFTRNALAQVNTLQQTGVWPKLSSPRAVWKMKRVKEMKALPLLLSVLAFQVTLQLQSARAGWIVKSSSNSSDLSDSGWRLLDNGTYVRVYGNQDAMGASGTQGSSGGEGSDTRENTDSGWVLSLGLAMPMRNMRIMRICGICGCGCRSKISSTLSTYEYLPKMATFRARNGSAWLCFQFWVPKISSLFIPLGFIHPQE